MLMLHRHVFTDKPFRNLKHRKCMISSRYLSGETSSKRDPVVNASLSSKLKMYSELSKFRLSSLVVATTGAGFLCAGSPIDWSTMVAACAGTALCAASASTFNQVIEKDLDVKMNRTKNRPLPSGKLAINEALCVAITAGATGTGILYAATNPVVAALGLANIFLYAGPYTLSKQTSEINTWIGAVVGAVPPVGILIFVLEFIFYYLYNTILPRHHDLSYRLQVMGWAAATGGSLTSAEPLALAALLYFWQFAHFFALSWLHREDYAKCGFQMVAVNDPTGQRTARLIWRYSLYLSALPLTVSALGMTSYMFAVEGSLANGYLLYLANNFKYKHSNANAKKVFLCSLWYLPLLLAGFVFHNRLWSTNEETDTISEAVVLMKEKLGAICVHNVLAVQNGGQNSAMCPKVAAAQLPDGIEIASAVAVTAMADDQSATRAAACNENSDPK